MVEDIFCEFCDKAEKAKMKGVGLKFLRYGKNLRYTSEGIYSYNTKIADLDLNFKTIRRRGTWSKTSSKHYNYALRILSDAYGFNEVSPAPPGIPREFIHVQNLSYDDHT